jgi:hypothetical protein
LQAQANYRRLLVAAAVWDSTYHQPTQGAAVKYLRVLVSISMLLMAISAAAIGRPLPLSPTFITAPPPGYRLFSAAFEGDWMIASGSAVNTPTAAVFLYRRGGLGPWVLQSKLAEVPYYYDWNTTGISLAMENGLLVFEIARKLYIYERAAVGYQPAAVLDNGYDSAAVRIDKARILAGLGTCAGAAVVEKNAAGVWAISGRLQTTTTTPCSDDFSYTDYLDVSGDYALVATRGVGRTTQVFRRAAGQLQWPKKADLTASSQYFSSTGVGLRGSLALVGGNSNEGTRVFQRPIGSSTWSRTGTLRTVDLYAGSQGHVGYIRQRAELWLLDGNIWRQSTDNTFEHLVRLDGNVWGEDIGGRTVVGGHGDGIATFILPTSIPASPATLRDNFQGAGNIGWLLDYGFTYAQSGFTRVLRKQVHQHAEALVSGADWLNQSVQVDVRPTAFNGSYGFVALTTRRSSDASTFYQARFKQNTVTLIRRTPDRGDLEIARAGVPFGTNRSYRLRFETRDSLLRVFVDGAQVISHTDRTHTHGSASLASEGVAADFDNVIVSPLWTSLFAPFDLGNGEKWTTRGGTWIDVNNQATPLARRQTDKTLLARSLTGVPETDDQIIETVVRIDSLPPSGDRWVGVIARYGDDANHYYASLGVNSGLQIRRVAGGSATVLASVPYAVVGNRNYRLRFEAVGNQLRAYVDDVFVAEAHDGTFGTGRFGVATNLAAASFYELSAAQP